MKDCNKQTCVESKKMRIQHILYEKKLGRSQTWIAKIIEKLIMCVSL